MTVRHCAWMVALALLGGPGATALDVGQESPTTVAPKQDQREPGDRRQGQRGPRKWWVDPSDRAELGIGDQQSAKIEEIWQAHRAPQWERHLESRKLEPIVDRLIKELTADPAAVAQQVQRLESLKADMNAARIVMLYRVMRELSPAQREKLKRLQERRDAEHRKSTDSQNRR